MEFADLAPRAICCPVISVQPGVFSVLASGGALIGVDRDCGDPSGADGAVDAASGALFARG
jgi:hypothetical protein